MDTVLGRWKSLSITEEEDGVLGVDDTLVEKGKGLRKFNLMAKIMIRKPYNREAFKKTMVNLWKVDKGCVVKLVERDVYLFSFESERERARVMAMEPWHFDNALVVLKELGDLEPLKSKEWNTTKFWLQISNLPSSGMIREIGEVIGRGFGKGYAVEVEADKDGCCVGHIMRIRVPVDVSKPLRRGARIRLGSNGEVVWVEARYERLPEFCYKCGRIGHGVKECLEEGTDTQRLNNSYEYGPWLRVGGIKKSVGRAVDVGERKARPHGGVEGLTVQKTDEQISSHRPGFSSGQSSGVSAAVTERDGLEPEKAELLNSKNLNIVTAERKFDDIGLGEYTTTNSPKVLFGSGKSVGLGPDQFLGSIQKAEGKMGSDADKNIQGPTKSVSNGALVDIESTPDEGRTLFSVSQGVLTFSTGVSNVAKGINSGSLKRRARVSTSNVSKKRESLVEEEAGKRKADMDILEEDEGHRMKRALADVTNVSSQDGSVEVAWQPHRV